MKWSARIATGLMALSLAALLFVDPGDLLLTYRHSKSEFTPAPIYVLQQIETRTDLRDIDLLIVGGSSTREFFLHDAALDRLLAEACGIPLRGYNAGTSSQSLEDSFALIETWSDRFGTTDSIVFGMTLGRLFESYDAQSERPSLGIPLSSVTQNARPFPANVFAGLGDRFDRVGRLSALVTSADWKPYAMHPIENRHIYQPPGKPLAERMAVSSIFADIYAERGLTSVEKNLEMLDNAVKHYGIDDRVTFVYTPISPVTRLAYADILVSVRHNRSLAAIGPTVDLTESSILNDGHFFDEQHLLQSGREEFWTSADGLSAARRIFCPT